MPMETVAKFALGQIGSDVVKDPQPTVEMDKLEPVKVVSVNGSEPSTVDIVLTPLPGLWYEIRYLARLGVSLAVAQTILFIQSAVTIAAAGHLSTSEQAGISLAVSFFNITVLAITSGLATASDALLAQAFGSRFKKMVGVFLQRSVVFFFVAFVVVTAINMYSHVIFVSLGQDPVISCIARYYLVMLTPGILGLYVYRLAVVYYRIQDFYWPILLSTAAGFVSAVGCGYVLAFVYELGVDGIAIANDLGYLAMGFSLIAYAIASKMYKKTCDGFSMQAFTGWIQFAKLGLAGIVLVATEFVFGEMLIFLAGAMGPVELSSQMICFQILLVCDMVHFGFSIACTVRVGMFLGGNQPERAKRVVILSVIMSIIPMTVLVGIVIGCRHYLGQIFTTDEETVETVSEVLVYCICCGLVEACYTNLNGALRGSARQGLASIVNILGMYGVGVPVLAALKLTDNLTLPYTWLTFAGSEVLIVLVYATILARTNWDEQAELANERVRTSRTNRDHTSDTLLGDVNEAIAINHSTSRSENTQSRYHTLNIVLKVSVIVVVLISALTACTLSLTGHGHADLLISLRNGSSYDMDASARTSYHYCAMNNRTGGH